MIVRVWGKADNIDLELHLVGKVWEVMVSPDLSDGQYAVTLYAATSSGEIGMWTGILFMSAGVACLRLSNDRFVVWLQPERTSTDCLNDRNKIIIKEGCRCVKL
jgi:hypothetical protein